MLETRKHTFIPVQSGHLSCHVVGMDVAGLPTARDGAEGAAQPSMARSFARWGMRHLPRGGARPGVSRQTMWEGCWRASSACDWPAALHRRHAMPLRHTGRRLTWMATLSRSSGSVARCGACCTIAPALWRVNPGGRHVRRIADAHVAARGWRVCCRLCASLRSSPYG